MSHRSAAGPSIHFRPALDDDVAALVDLVESAYRGERSRRGWSFEADLLDGQRIDSTMLRGALRDVATRVLVAEIDDELVGCCELRRPGAEGAATLGMFAVDPARQDSGLGRRILNEAERIVCHEWDADRLRLAVIDLRSELIGWYERRGYRRTGETEPFPYGDERFGVPRRDDLCFAVLEKRLRASD